MKRVIAIVFFISSCLLYLFSPSNYSFSYCLWCHNLFLATAAFVLISDFKNEKVGFNLLFTVSFFFTNFVYPIYIYPIDPSYSLFQFPFNENVITKCTALAQVAYSTYSIGFFWEKPNPTNDNGFQHFPSISNAKYYKSELAVCLLVIVFILLGGLEYFEDRYLRGDLSSNLLVQYMMIIFIPIIILYASLIYLCKSHKQIVRIHLILLVITIVLLSSGTRTFPLIILACLFIIFCQRHKVSFTFVMLCVIFGVVLMSYVGDSRSTGVFASGQDVIEASQFGVIEKFSDLFINNRNLYVLYDFVSSHSCTYGLSMISNLLSPIPFAQGLFIKIFGIPPHMLGSASFSTYLEFGVNPPLGLGTNIVGDVYLAFGNIGIFIFFFSLGYFIWYIRERMWHGSYMYLLIYLILASDAVYMCRAAFFDALKNILWTLLFANLFFTKSNNEKHPTNHTREYGNDC